MVIIIKAMLDTCEYKHLKGDCALAMLNQFSKMREPTQWNGLDGFGKYNNRDVAKQFKRLITLGYIRPNNNIYEFWGDPTACLKAPLFDFPKKF